MATCCTFSTHCTIWSAGGAAPLVDHLIHLIARFIDLTKRELQGEERKGKKPTAYLRQHEIPSGMPRKKSKSNKNQRGR
jgi:hypothetical protein